ncbi:MAG: DMT family transporter [Pseudolabrys sp.]|nr:DMT family transporter [Pseudolabrys sp.]
MMPTKTEFAHQRRQRLIGIALMCGAVALFACLDATGKYLNHHMDTMQVVWARYTGAFLLALLIANPINHPGMLVTRRPFLQIGRSALLLFSTALNFIALRYLQLDEALSILFSTPFIVAVLCGPLLGEWVGWRRWTAIGVGFFGVLLVARPGFGGIHPAALLSLGSAVCYAVYAISTRVLARTDSNETTLFYSNLVGAVAMLPVIPFVWTAPENGLIVALMVLIGALGSGGHYLLIVGHRLAPASVLAPFIYTQVVWTTALGFLVFGDVPHRWTIVGGLIVVSSGLYLLNRERKVGKPAPSTPVA